MLLPFVKIIIILPALNLWTKRAKWIKVTYIRRTENSCQRCSSGCNSRGEGLVKYLHWGCSSLTHILCEGLVKPSEGLTIFFWKCGWTSNSLRSVWNSSRRMFVLRDNSLQTNVNKYGPYGSYGSYGRSNSKHVCNLLQHQQRGIRSIRSYGVNVYMSLFTC